MEKKNIVISGGSRGLGKALSESLVKAGHSVYAFGRTKKLNFDPIYSYKAVDITSYNEVKKWADHVLEEIGAPDLLIHNAALINELKVIEELSPKDMKDVVDVNVTGVLNLTHAFIPSMKARKKGGIIGISSYWGREGAKSVVPYCGTKFAIEGICQSLALELDAPMFSVPLNPGIIDTEMLYLCFGDHSHEYPTAEEWAEKATPFILSLSRRHNGESMTVPGF
jgi:NAD(P)-dependent dehydrogenase (short-subunit alcohol dehydrogenase family)